MKELQPMTMSRAARTRAARGLFTVMTAFLQTTMAIGAAGSEIKLHDDRQAIADTQWSAARQVLVTNTAAIDDTVAVVVGVTGKPGMAYAVVDEAGRPLVTQADDLDGDAAADEVCFLLRVKAKQQRTVMLLGAKADLPTTVSDLQVKAHTAASWAPVRVQPTRSSGPQQHSTYLSPVNAARTHQLMDRLEKHVPMEVVACPDFRVLVGHESGLIEGMRPTNIPASLVGSYLREYLPNADNLAPMTRRFAGPVRCGYQWRDGARRITVYRNGVIESAWATAPAAVQVIVCAYPYRFMQTGPQDIVRYSQMLEMRRDLSAVDTLGFFGRADASLRVAGEGLRAVDHQVWLDSGEIGFEVGLAAHLKEAPATAVPRLTRYLNDTYIGGGLHLTSWQGDGATAALRYRIGNLGGDVFGAGIALVQVKAAALTAPVPVVQLPPTPPALSLNFKKTTLTVNRLYPNEINGWELRPVTLAKHNPQPAYFPAELVNNTDAAIEVPFAIKNGSWIHTASILSNCKTLTIPRFPDSKLAHFYSETQLVPDDAPISITVPAGQTMPIEVFVRPAKGTLGKQQCTLHYGGGTVDLTVLVKPTLLFMPMFAPLNELGSEVSNLTGPEGAPLSYGMRFWGGYSPQLRHWYKASHRDAERKGFWTYDPIHIRGLAERHAAEVKEGKPGVDLTKWSKGLQDVMHDEDWVAYRARVYMHDEIHGAVGNKGNYVVPLAWLIDADRRIVMNNPTAAWPSFQEGAVTKDFKYQATLPNDISELFYYCGRDSGLQDFARMLVEPRREIFKKWQADPKMMALAGTDDPKQIISYWISTQIHVANYKSVRRQIWWLRHNGIDAFNSWACSSGYRPYLANRIMHWMFLYTKSPGLPRGDTARLLTDRAIAWMDMKADMELVTLVRLLLDQVNDETILAKLKVITQQALDASQQNQFDAARNHYMTALKLLRPDLVYLAPPDLYQGPVKAETLPDLFADDVDSQEARTLPKIRVPLLDGDAKLKVDGVLDDVYRKQGVAMKMRNNHQGSRPEAPTLIHMARDADNLYIVFQCFEPNIFQVRTDRKERDSPVWTDAHVRLLFDRTGDGKEAGHFIINSAGVSFDTHKGLGKAWSPEIESAGTRDDQSWTVEIRIPFVGLGGDVEPGETWRMNFCRRRYSVDDWQAWSVTYGDFHTRERYGFVQFK